MAALAVCAVVCTSSCNPENTGESNNDNVPKGVVDIGLSVYWGECNVGATKPEETGDLYAWGEIETKDKMSWDNYKWSEGDYNKLTKYNYNEDFGRADNNAQLEIADDIAYIKSSGQMRMPTERELNELFQTRENSNYQWEHKSLNG